MSSNPLDRGDNPWVPDGVGLPAEVLADVTRRLVRVHLRLSSRGRYPKTACGRGLGQWWTGRPSEATCPACLEEFPKSKRSAT